MYYHWGEPPLSAQASRPAPRPDPAADHRGRDRAAPDDRAGGDNSERDRRARRGRKGHRLPPLPRRTDPRPRVQRPVLQAPPLPRPRPLACPNRPSRAIANRTARDLRLPPRHPADDQPRSRARPPPPRRSALPQPPPPRHPGPRGAMPLTGPPPAPLSARI